MIDFVLANLVNSGVLRIRVLLQYRADSLTGHLDERWRPYFEACGGDFGYSMAEEARTAYAGTADAVYRNLDVIGRCRYDLVAVFAADHVYRMDIRQMIDYHRRRRAGVTIAGAPVPLEKASAFGIIDCDAEGRVEKFLEKPASATPMRQSPQCAFASMGNYLFDPDLLCRLLRDNAARGGTDFGHHVLPDAVRSGLRVFAYDFSTNFVPGLKPHETPAYWRDVGTLDALNSARRDVRGRAPRLDLRNPEWPLRPVGFSRALPINAAGVRR